MNKLRLVLTLGIAFFTQAGFAQSSPVIRQYVAQYKEIAMQEMLRTGVPASITLAQGILETEAGQSKLVKKSNNHFGIKCKSDWKGASVSHDDDARGECFRKYDDPIDSYKDHSDFLKTRSHYASLFQLDPADYEAWAYGLKKAGYATNPKYPQLLIKLIRDYNLQDYSLIALGKKTAPEEVVVTSNERTAVTAPVAAAPVKTYPSGVFRINETKVIFITAGTSYLVVAQEHHLPLARLFDFNDMQPAEAAAKDHLLYLQRKRKTGASEEHIVQPGETVWDIAQAEGIRLESLLAFNYLRADVNPSPGRKIYLQGAAKQTVFAENETPETKPEAVQAVNRYGVHTVEQKETLYAISKKYGVTVQNLVEWNALDDTDLKQGQQLRINK